MLTYGPTFEEMLHPEKLDPQLRQRAREALVKDPLSPLNLYNISWKGADDRVRHLVLPHELTGIDAEIVVLLGRYFPTGSHKVGATYSCCIERQVRGQVQPGKHRLVWPSTGNYGIGGAYVGPRMGYDSLVILPELMSQERFDKITWYGAKYVKTPGCESSVKEIYDKTHELEHEQDTIIVNQFAEFGNYRFHHYVTGNSILALFDELKGKGLGTRLSGFTSAMGSSGTIAAGDRLVQAHPEAKIVGLEPVQCPTLFCNGFGGHDIQGIGDKHVTWIHNTDTMAAVACIDEWDCKKGLQVIAEEPGRKVLARMGVKGELLEEMAPSFGISGICNVLGAIKTAKHYRMGKGDILFTIATDGLDRYPSVLAAMTKELGRMDEAEAERRIVSIFHHQGEDWYQEGTQHARDCWANLKYYTWVEQQGKTVDELRRQRSREYWLEHQALLTETDKLIKQQRPAGGDKR
jgi:cysteine synthase A